MAASGDFGPFFGFTVSARVSARHIGRGYSSRVTLAGRITSVAFVAICATWFSPAVPAEPAARVGISHVNIAVANLDGASADYARLGFALKEGRPHPDGIRNRHVKFPDGTEIELITAPEATDALTTHYRQLIGAGDGPAFLSLDVEPPGRRRASETGGSAGVHQRQARGLSVRKPARLRFLCRAQPVADRSPRALLPMPMAPRVSSALRWPERIWIRARLVPRLRTARVVLWPLIRQPSIRRRAPGPRNAVSSCTTARSCGFVRTRRGRSADCALEVRVAEAPR